MATKEAIREGNSSNFHFLVDNPVETEAVLSKQNTMEEIQALKSRLVNSTSLSDSISQEVLNVLQSIQERLDKLEIYVNGSSSATPNTLSPSLQSPVLLSPSLSPGREITSISEYPLHCPIKRHILINKASSHAQLLSQYYHNRNDSKSTTESSMDFSVSYAFPQSPDTLDSRGFSDDFSHGIQKAHEECFGNEIVLSAENKDARSALNSQLEVDHAHSSTSTFQEPHYDSTDSLLWLFDEFCEIISFSGSNIEKEKLKQRLKTDQSIVKSPLVDYPAFFMPKNSIELLIEITPKLLGDEFTDRCLQAYRVRRSQELKRNLHILDYRNTSREEFESMSWDELSTRMIDWLNLMDIIVKIMLPGERLLCEQVFHGHEELIDSCFILITEEIIHCMLKQAEDMYSCKLMPEKVTCLLEIFDSVSSLKSEAEKFGFTGEENEGNLNVHASISCFLQELSSIIHETLMHFAKLVENEGIPNPDYSSSSSTPSVSESYSSSRVSSMSRSSRIKLTNVMSVILKNITYANMTKEKGFRSGMRSYAHKGRLPLTSYVINYVILLCNKKGDYFKILSSMYKDYPPLYYQNGPYIQKGIYACANIFLHILTALIENLEKKSQLFKDEGACQVFLLNNIHYILVNVVGSDVKDLVGSEWCRHLEGVIQNRCHRLILYVFSKFGHIFKSENQDDDISSTTLKQKLNSFNTAIEGLYEQRCLHIIPDNRLKAYVVGEISKKISTSYSDFLDKHCSLLMSRKKLKKLCIHQPENLQSTIVNCFSQM